MKHSIEDIEKKEDSILIQYKDKQKYYYLSPILEDAETIKRMAAEKESLVIVTINSKENLNFLANNWDMLINTPDFTIIFINPFSELDHKWMIKPYVHNMITENSALKGGLKSMFATVDSITEKEFLKKIS